MNEMTKILSHEAMAILNIPTGYPYPEVVDLIHLHAHKMIGKVVTTGIGKAGEIARSIATTLSSTGTPAVYLHPAEAQHGDLGVLQPYDLLLAVSNSGKTREVLELVYLAKVLRPELPLVVITGDLSSELAEQAKYAIPTGSPKEVCPLGVTPTTSTTVMSVIGDILVVLLMKKIKFTKAEYAKRHHGGYIGEILTSP